MKFKPYPVYKDSGVEWLGDVPEKWQAISLKFLLSEPLMYGANEPAENDNPNEPRYIRITDIKDDETLNSNTFKSLPMTLAKPYLLNDGAILLARSGATTGKSFLYNKSWGVACFAGYLIKASPNQKLVLSKFISYFTKSNNYWLWLSSSQIQATIENVSAEKYGNLRIPVPPLLEQTAIANFLDKETRRIDALAEDKNRFIALLKEKCQALISHAVTKGLDSTVKMKDSGVEWLGDVPEHWEKSYLKFTTHKIIDTEHKTAPFYEDGEYHVVRTSDVKNTQLVKTSAKYTNEDVYRKWTLRGKPEAGDILFTREAPAGEACIVPKNSKLCLGQRMVLFKVNHKKLLPEFLLYSIYGGLASDFIQQLSQGSTVIHFNMADIKNIPLFEVPINEQKKIANYLDRETKKIDQLIQATESSIELLKEHRTALISAAVTGKIDLRD